MKLVTFYDERRAEKVGLLTTDSKLIVDLQEASRKIDGCSQVYFENCIAFLNGGEEAKLKARDILSMAEQNSLEGCTSPLSERELLSPIPRPESIKDCMLFEDHIINCIRNVGLKKLAPFDRFIERLFGRKKTIAYKMNKAWYERPIYYKGNRFSVVGTGSKVYIPHYTSRFDYELEWGIVIGKKGKNIPVEKAGDYIAGYAIYNDFSARDIQMKEQGGRLGPAKGKDFDSGNAIGPWLVTADEIENPYNLEMKAKVNGELWSLGNTSEMSRTFEEVISYISQSETLYPGEFIGSGTCSGKSGVGCGLEHGKFLKSGDVIELEVEKIGILKNVIV